MEFLPEKAGRGSDSARGQRGGTEQELASEPKQAVNNKNTFSRPALPLVLLQFNQIHKELREIAPGWGTAFPPELHIYTDLT